MENLLKDKPDPLGKVLENVGYSKTLAEQPSRIIEAPGFKEALSDLGLKQALINQGVTPEKIAEKVNVLLNGVDKEGNCDYTAIDKGLKHATAIYGIEPDAPKNPTGNTYNFLFSTETQQRIKSMEDEIKKLLTKPHVQEN